VLDALGNLGDFIGGIAVVITLAYLAVQVRQNTKQLERSSKVAAASAYHSITALILDGNGRIAINREFAELRVRGEADLDNLDPVDRRRFMASASSLFRLQENLLEQHAAGLITDEQYASWALNLRRHLSARGMRQAWSGQHQMFSSAFQAKVEGLIAEALASADSPAPETPIPARPPTAGGSVPRTAPE
jgi:hypothetical protein